MALPQHSAKEQTGVKARDEQRGGLASRTVRLWVALVPLALLLCAVVVWAQMPDGRLHIWVLDVGQGDAILIRTPGGHTAIVDGGPGATPLLNAVGRDLPFWQHKVDLVVLTHPHDDHLAGLAELVERYEIGQVAQTVFSATGGVGGVWRQRLAQRGVEVANPARGSTITFAGEPDVTLRVLSPRTPDASDEQGGGLNNTSIVLRLEYGKHSFLLEGDAQLEAEGEMLQADPDFLRSDVLKVGHHGSDTSSSPAFLRVVSPQVAVISVGEGNRYGHPAPQTLDALEDIGAQVIRTDQSGTVEFIADRDNLWVRPERMPGGTAAPGVTPSP